MKKNKQKDYFIALRVEVSGKNRRHAIMKVIKSLTKDNIMVFIEGANLLKK